MMRRVITLVAIGAALLALAASPAQAQGVDVAAEGPTAPGETVTVTCPEHHTFHSGTVTFYPAKRSPHVITTLALEHTADLRGGTAVAPRGAHYYRASAFCHTIIVMLDFSGSFSAASEQATVLCPPETPYLWAASPTIFFGEEGGTLLAQTIIRDPVTGQPYGVSFTAPGPGTWSITLHCSAVLSPWEPT